jgi:hypothetical protein
MADLGRQVKYGLGKETVYGTPVTATTTLNQLGFELNPKNEYVNNESAYGVLERTNHSTATKSWSEGSLEAKLTSDSFGHILLGTFGTVVSADNPDTNPIVKDHTFTINQNVAGQSYTLYRKDSVSTMRYPGSRFGQCELSFDLDDYVKFTADVLAKKGVSTTFTPAYTDETEFVAKHFSVKTASSVAGLSGATAESALESLTLTINPNIEADYSAGNVEPYSITSRGYEISVEATCRYNNQTYENAFNTGTPLALQVTAKNTDVIIGAAANPGVVFTAPKMIITDWARNEDLDSPVTQTFTGTIHYSPADAYALQAVLTNATASY